jgi:hypothetical protein
MQFCQRCRTREATMQFSRKVDGRESVNAHLCEECAKPLLARQEALCQGPQPCEVCGGNAFSPVPGLRRLAYVCCGCRNRYRQIFFELCADQRPDLIERSEGDISFFDMCLDSEIEDWADLAGNKAMKLLGSPTSGNE